MRVQVPSPPSAPQLLSLAVERLWYHERLCAGPETDGPDKPLKVQTRNGEPWSVRPDSSCRTSHGTPPGAWDWSGMSTRASRS
jgi:hypothetical protein